MSVDTIENINNSFQNIMTILLLWNKSSCVPKLGCTTDICQIRIFAISEGWCDNLTGNIFFYLQLHEYSIDNLEFHLREIVKKNR